MRYIDISMPLSEVTPVYEGDPPFRIHALSRVRPSCPDTYNASKLELGTHVGTHLDPPKHFFNDGMTGDQIPLNWLCGLVRVVDLRSVGTTIHEDVLRAIDLEGISRLILKTAPDPNPRNQLFWPSDRSLSLDAAQFLKYQTSVRLIGIDALSIEAFASPGMPVHHLLLGGDSPVIIIEGLDLRDVAPGDYELLCLPLRIQDSDGVPARVVLRDMVE